MLARSQPKQFKVFNDSDDEGKTLNDSKEPLTPQKELTSPIKVSTPKFNMPNVLTPLQRNKEDGNPKASTPKMSLTSNNKKKREPNNQSFQASKQQKITDPSIFTLRDSDMYFDTFKDQVNNHPNPTLVTTVEIENCQNISFHAGNIPDSEFMNKRLKAIDRYVGNSFEEIEQESEQESEYESEMYSDTNWENFLKVFNNLMDLEKKADEMSEDIFKILFDKFINVTNVVVKNCGLISVFKELYGVNAIISPTTFDISNNKFSYLSAVRVGGMYATSHHFEHPWCPILKATPFYHPLPHIFQVLDEMYEMDLGSDSD